MAQLGKFSGPMMRRGTGFHTNQTGRQLRGRVRSDRNAQASSLSVVVGPRNHRQRTPCTLSVREFLFSVYQRQDCAQLSMEIDGEAALNWGHDDPFDHRLNDLDGFLADG